jgi:hypothetical protein
MRFAREDAAATAFAVVAVGAYAGYLAFGGTPFIKHVESEAVFAVLIGSIVALRACRRPLGGPAADTPARSACPIEAHMPINHLIYAVLELRTAHELEERIGVRAERGSKYVGFGTHNVLLAPGAGTSLQIIAADREQPSPSPHVPRSSVRCGSVCR